MGRPSKYQPEMVDQARKLCALGATNAQLAEFFDVSGSTFDEWLTRHADLAAAVREAKGDLDAQVERSLFQRATGYSHPETKLFQHEGAIISEEVTKHYPPDTTAAIFWLKNRQPGRWRDVNRIEHTGKDGEPLKDVSTCDLRLLLQALRGAEGGAGSGD